jgi:hypothetical protein
MIKKINGFYIVVSEKTYLRGGKRVRRTFGRYKKKEDAEKRLRQIEFFKHLKKRE